MHQKIIEQISANFNPQFPIVEFKLDETIYRSDFRKKDDKYIWIIGKEWVYKNNTYYCATAGNWSGRKQITIKSWDDKDVDKNFTKAMNKQLEITRERTRTIKEKTYKECKEKWWPIYSKADPGAEVHPYLKRKAITNNFGSRVDSYGNLLIAGWNQDGFVGVQRIIWSDKEDRYIKRYSKGFDKQGSFCPVGSGWKTAKFLYVAEGFATGASVHMATGNPVCVVWDCGNFISAIQTIRFFNPTCNIIMCADVDNHPDDPNTHRIGERKARWAAKQFSNIIVKLVQFSRANDSLSDFNDLHKEESLEAVTDQLKIDLSDFVDIICLGHQDKKNFYFSTQTNELYPLSAAEHNKVQLSLMAPEKYWGDNFGYKYDKEGEETDKADWDKVIAGLGMRQAKHGFFNPKMIRGYGAWLDNGKLIINAGNKLIYDGEYRPIFNHGINTRCFYEANQSLDISIDDPLDDEGSMQLIEAFKNLEYKNKNDYIYILGWIVTAQVFGALDWRAHIHITGPRGSGKSTVLSCIKKMIPLAMLVQDSSAAGIRQTIKNNATPIVYDESEADDDKIKAINAMARQASDRKDAVVARGTTSGKAQHFNATVTFCMGSIQRSKLNAADESRFFAIEMNKLDHQTHQKFSSIEQEMEIASKQSKKLFARVGKNFDTLKSNIKIIKNFLRTKKLEARQADQLSCILGGYYLLTSTDKIEDYEIEGLVSKIDFFSSDYIEENTISESEKCLNTILELPVDNRNMSIEKLIHNLKYSVSQTFSDDYEKELSFFGLRYFAKDEVLFISANNSQLKDRLKRFSNYEDYMSLLKRHENFVKYSTCWIMRAVKGVYIKYLTTGE